jgi:uncharacterized protein
MTETLERKMVQLQQALQALHPLAVAFSGGVDSSLLLAAAVDALGRDVLAVTAVSPLHPRRETRLAIALARDLGVRHLLLRSDEMGQDLFTANPPDRCYHCKRGLLGQIWQAVRCRGYTHLVHGANRDDLGDYRPGQRAAREMAVMAPLIDVGLDKGEIRALAQRRGLPNWNQPSMACLASRIPHGTPITAARLAQIEAAEEYLQDKGFRGPRVRWHGEVARIECRDEETQRILSDEMRREIAAHLKALGFRFVTVDLEGYRMGSLNPEQPDSPG